MSGSFTNFAATTRHRQCSPPLVLLEVEARKMRRREPLNSGRIRTNCCGVILRVLFVWAAVVSQLRLVHAQMVDSVTISDAVSCPRCEIRYTLVGYYGGPNDEHLVRETSRLVVDGKGRVYASAADQVHVAAFDAQGQYRGAIGKAGEGPGENGTLAHIVIGPGDSVFVVGRTGRGGVYSPDLQYVRPFRVPPSELGFRPLSGGRAVVVARTGPMFAAQPLIVVDSLGMATSAFGGLDRRVDPRCAQCSIRRAVPSSDGSVVWLDYPSRYRIEGWDVATQSVHILQRHVPWLPDQVVDRQPPASREQVEEFARGVQAIRMGAAVDKNNRVWYRYFSRSHPDGSGYRIDVIDATSGTLLFTGKDMHPVQWWVNGDFTYRPEVDAEGYVRLGLYRVELINPG